MSKFTGQMKKVLFGALFLSLALPLSTYARGYKDVQANQSNKKGASHKTLDELCAPSRAQSELDINNIRTTILGGGDMWWDLNLPRYEVPKGGGRHSMFAGSLWLGGVDEGNQLKLAAQTYRQRGNDFWTGPLSNDGTANVTKDICDRYDRHWLIYREEVELHRAWLFCKDNPDCDLAENFDGYNIPRSIMEWPGNGIDGELDYMLAPFIDRDGDGVYDPEFDYPAYDLASPPEFDCRLKETDLVYGDQTLWWVYNDRGNIHTNTTAGALGFEIRAQAFSFTTNDEINNMTFNNYRILNKSTFRLTNTYFGSWFDADLGNPIDDIIGCDIPRGLGYVYNADPFDAGPFGYGFFPPAVGLDFFQGPFADYFDGLDNDRDGCIDAVRDFRTGICIPEDPALGINERIIMSGFMYYNNTSNSVSGNPANGVEFYNYLQTRWRNGADLFIETPCGIGCTGNGDGFIPSNVGEKTLFAYPGMSFDTTGVTPPTSPSNWFESPDNKEDKRGLHCAGPFSLAPGALNFITTGTVWARDLQDDFIFASVEKVIFADDKAQALFDNCFQVLNGPDAPNMQIVELDREIIINLTYEAPSNNIGLSYREEDPLIPVPDGSTRESLLAQNPDYFEYVFEGFQIFQMRDANVSISEIYDPARARLVAQVDLRNDITQLINWSIDPNMNLLIPKDMTLQANNNGIRTSFRVNEDLFAAGVNRALINQKEYFYTVVAYAQNQYEVYHPQQAPSGQRVPFLAGRRNIRTYTALPHKTEPKSGGTILSSSYGDSPQLTRIEGIGNGGLALEFTPETEDSILRNYRITYPTYQIRRGPVDIKVVDPLAVPEGDYIFKMDGVSPSSNWEIIRVSDDVVVANSQSTISVFNEQIIPQLGMSVALDQVRNPGNDDENERNAGIITSDILFSDDNARWLDFIRDDNSQSPFNWILAGGNTRPSANTIQAVYRDLDGDNLGRFSTILGGAWGPFAYSSTLRRDNRALSTGQTPIWGMGPRPAIIIPQWSAIQASAVLHSVDIVFTSDHTKWTRVPVFEMCEDPVLAEGNAPIFTLRRHPGWSKDANGALIPDPDNPGWSYFPGYAIDLETGERLNMAFGENSWNARDRGNDLLWNPTSRVGYFPADEIQGGFAFAGQHYIYVFHPKLPVFPSTEMPYKGDNPKDHPMYPQIEGIGSVVNANTFWRHGMWVSIPRVTPRYQEMNPYTNMPSEARVQIRMQRPYAVKEIDNSNNGFPKYTFSTDNLAPRKNQLAVGQDALDLIKVVPNPYYGLSAYEASQLDNNVKITNLPQRCNISIFTTNGTMIRTIRKDNNVSFAMWDLRNDYNVPIASGVYIIHIDAGELGEKVIKFMGAMRPVDLNAF
jgi:hypothetical protein